MAKVPQRIRGMKRFKSLAPAEGAQVLLEPDDLTYLGMFRVPFGTAATKIPFEVRDNDGTPSFLFWNPNLSELIEVDYPGVGLDPMVDPPRATELKNFGDVTDGILTTGVANTQNGVTFNGMTFDPTDSTRIWCGYRCSYPVSAGTHNPSIFVVDLNFGTEASTTYGPWLTEEHGDKTNGYFFTLPAAWATTYNEGRRLCAGAAQGSINQNCPVGPEAVSFEDVDPTTLPPDLSPTGSPVTTSIPTYRMVHHDETTPLARTTDYRVCGWADPGNFSTVTVEAHAGDTSIAVADTSLYAQPGSWLEAYGYYLCAPAAGSDAFFYSGRSTSSGPGFLTGIPPAYIEGVASPINGTITVGTGLHLSTYDDGRGFFNNVGEATWNNQGYRVDTCAGMTFVETDSKIGMIGCGYMLKERDGVTYADGVTPHLWYTFQGNPCPHDHDPLETEGTGQKSDPMTGLLFFYDTTEVAAAVAGSRSPSSMTPVLKDVSTYSNWAGNDTVTTGWQYQNIKYHRPTRKLFMVDVVRPDPLGGWSPVVHVWEVAA
jgi:hypothetical protein